MAEETTVKPSWTARVLIYQGSNSLEEVMFDSYEAASESSARAIAVELGFGYLKTLGLNDKECGCRIIMVAPDKPIGAGASSYNRSGGQQVQHTSRRGTNRPQPAFVPFKCPIVKLCKLQYTGITVGNSFNIKHMPLPDTKEDA